MPGYMGQETPDAEEDEHLPEGKPLSPVEPRSGEAHEEGYNDRRTQDWEGRIVEEGEQDGEKP